MVFHLTQLFLFGQPHWSMLKCFCGGRNFPLLRSKQGLCYFPIHILQCSNEVVLIHNNSLAKYSRRNSGLKLSGAVPALSPTDKSNT